MSFDYSKGKRRFAFSKPNRALTVIPKNFKPRRTVPRLFTSLFITSLAGVFVPLAHAVVWQGSVSTDWSDAANWSPAGVPGVTDDVTVGGATFTPAIGAATSAAIRDLAVTKGELTVSAGKLEAAIAKVGTASGGSAALSLHDAGRVSSVSGAIAAANKSNGTVHVDGKDSVWANGKDLVVGGRGTGTLMISGAGVVKSVSADGNVGGSIGTEAGGVGSVQVQGQGSAWESKGELVVGQKGEGTLTLLEGGHVTNDTAIVGNLEKSKGTVTVDGTGSTWTSSAGLNVGGRGAGSLTIRNGGTVTSAEADGAVSGVIGGYAGAAGSVQVQGPGSVWESKGRLDVGQFGEGTLSVRDGARVVNDGVVQIAAQQNGVGNVAVDGKDSVWASGGSLFVGARGTGSLAISTGGVVRSGQADGHSSAHVGTEAGAVGSVVVQGGGSTWQHRGDLSVGYAGEGTLSIRDGGHVENGGAKIGAVANSTGAVVVDGKDSLWASSKDLGVGVGGSGPLTPKAGEVTSAGAFVAPKGGTERFEGLTWANAGDLAVGAAGTGSLAVTNGGQVTNTHAFIGMETGANGSVTVDGNGSLWRSDGILYVGRSGSGTLKIGGGGKVVNMALTGTAFYVGSTGAVVVDGAGSTWESHEGFAVGVAGNGSLTIRNAGLVKSAASKTGEISARIGMFPGGTGSVLVEGPASAWEIQGELEVADGSEGTLTIRGGGRVSDDVSDVAKDEKAKGAVVVDGRGSAWNTTGALQVATKGTGSLTVGNDGSVKASKVSIAQKAGAIGTLNIGAGADAAATGAGTLDTPTVEFGQGTGKLVFNHTNTDYRFLPVISGPGSVEVHAGTTRLADANTYSGGTAILGGTLAGTAASFGSGAIANDGELVVDQAVNAAFNNALSGKGNLTKRGAGQLDFVGQGSAFTGATRVEAGALSVVNDLLIDSSITVASGGTLKGKGAIGTTRILAGGTIAPGGTLGTGDGMATFIINGDFTQAAGSTYQAKVNPVMLGRSDKISVIGAATLEEGAVLNVVKTKAHDYSLGAKYNVLQAETGITGAYTLTGDTDLSAFIGLRQGTADNVLYLETFQAKPLAAVAVTPNQTAVANAIDPAAPIAPPTSNFIRAGKRPASPTAAEPAPPVAVQPTAPAVVQPTAPVVVQPTAPVVVQPTAPIVVQPTAPVVVQPTAPVVVQPTAPVVVQPTAPVVVQPTAPAVVQPTAPVVVRPTAPTAVRPVAPVATQPTAAAASQPSAPAEAPPATPSAPQAQPPRSVLTTALLNQQTDAAARAAFDQLSGDVHASLKGALLDDSRFVRGAALERLRDASCNAASGCSASRSTPTVWASTFGSWGHAAQLDRTIGGFAAGADVAVGDTWRLGVMTGYSHSSFQADARHASAKSDDYHLGVYGGSRWGDLALRLGTAYTRHDIDTTRNVSFSGFSGKPEAQYRASTTQAFGELGYQVQAGAVALEPFANLAYVNLHTNRFNERGGEAALRSSGTDNDAAFTTLGVHAQAEWALGGVPVTAKGTLGWQHALGDTVPDARFSLAGGRSFEIEGTPIARDAALVEAGLNFKVAPQANLSLTYSGRYGAKANDQSLRASFAMKF
nr:autotransporter domain-containing protein [Variovorax sp. IB41]